jgi:serine/threonine-protein kinase HipA
MRKAHVFYNNKIFVGTLIEHQYRSHYTFEYDVDYTGSSVSLNMPLEQKSYAFNQFPHYFEGVLPEGWQLQGLLAYSKIDSNDLFGQLMLVGNDLVGAFTVKEVVLEK